MILYFKVGTMPGKHYKPVKKYTGGTLRHVPQVGEFFDLKDPLDKWARPIGVHLLEIGSSRAGESLFIVEKF